MKINRVFLFLFAVALLLGIAPTIAQDVTEEPLVTNTPAATEAPTLEPTPAPEPIDPVQTSLDFTAVIGAIIAGIVGFISGAGVTGGIVLAVVRSFNNTQKEALRRLYASVPVESREKIRELLRDVDEVIEFGKEITAPDVLPS